VAQARHPGLISRKPYDPQGRCRVPLGLDQQIQPLALTVDSSPQVHAPALERDHPLVQVLPPGGPGSQPAQGAGESGAKFQNPASDGLIRGLDAPLGQESLDIAVAQREPEVEPDCVPDDLGWELAARIGDSLYAPALPRTLPCRPPFRDIACRPPNAGGSIALSQRTVLLPRRAAISIFWLASLKPDGNLMEGLRRPSLDDMIRLDKKLARKLMI
jgi:hypothetical protein